MTSAEVDVAAAIDVELGHNVLYRMFNRRQQLLYVGITTNVETRLGQHRHSRPWWPDIATITLEHFASRAEVVSAEAEAIKTEDPLHNLQHTGGETTLARFRLPHHKWEAFGLHAEIIGADRSKLVNEFVDWIAANPELWRDVRTIAERRQELLGAVVLAAFSRYRARHRVLLDEAEKREA